jgi:carboxymethylenebutenolidase
MTTAHDGDAIMEATGLTRRQALKVGAATFVGYAVAVEKVEAQAIKTDTAGIEVGDYAVKIGDYNMPVYEARPAGATNAPIIIAIGEVWGVHEFFADYRPSYNAAAAAEGWKRCLAHFDKHLKA